MKRVAKNVVLSGIQPTGFIHLGNYLGAVQNWVQLQNNPAVDKRYYSIVDLHALTQKYVGSSIDEDIENNDDLLDKLNSEPSPQELTLKTAATLLACGINPTTSSTTSNTNQSVLFVQSHVSAHSELMWLLSCMTPLSWLNKMIQFKEKKGGKGDNRTGLSLYSYPVLMAADILCYKANLVPVGEDQTQHLELAKDIAQRFNRLFAQNGIFFPIPDKLSFKDSPWVYNRVMSL